MSNLNKHVSDKENDYNKIITYYMILNHYLILILH